MILDGLIHPVLSLIHITYRTPRSPPAMLLVTAEVKPRPAPRGSRAP